VSVLAARPFPGSTSPVSQSPPAFAHDDCLQATLASILKIPDTSVSFQTGLAVLRTLPSHAACVSVVIPAHNAAGTIGQTLTSLATERDVIGEIILIDDASQDDTADVATRTARSLGLPLVVQYADCRCPGGARNVGLDHAVGHWIYLFDADDIHHNGGLRALVEADRAGPGPDLVLGGYHLQRAGRGRGPMISPTAAGCSAETYLKGEGPVIVVGSALIRASALGTLRFHPGLAYDEDTLFWAALLRSCRIAAVDRAVMTYHVSLARSDDRLALRSLENFRSWRAGLWTLEPRGISRHALRCREAFMAIKIARIHLARDELELARHFLAVAWSAPKTIADRYRWLRMRLKLARRDMQAGLSVR
jgi:glycosyltransferase involved in cell wall biosynthesis